MTGSSLSTNHTGDCSPELLDGHSVDMGPVDGQDDSLPFLVVGLVAYLAETGSIDLCASIPSRVAAIGKISPRGIGEAPLQPASKGSGSVPYVFNEYEPASRLENPYHFVQGVRYAGDRTEDQRTDDCIHALLLNFQALGQAGAKLDLHSQPGSLLHKIGMHCNIGLDSDPFNPLFQELQIHACSRTDLQDCAGELAKQLRLLFFIQLMASLILARHESGKQTLPQRDGFRARTHAGFKKRGGSLPDPPSLHFQVTSMAKKW